MTQVTFDRLAKGAKTLELARSVLMNQSLSRIQRFRNSNHKFLARFVLVSVTVAAAYVAYFWYDQLFTSPIELYHRVWQSCEHNYYDKDALSNWAKFEHCYDNKIKNEDDAILYANKMLSSLGDPFTVLRSPSELKQLADLQSEKYIGIGVLLEPITARWNGTKYLAVVSVMPNSPALEAGLKPGDTILKIIDRESAGMTVAELKAIVAKRENQTTPILVQRGKRKLRFNLVPKPVHLSNVELIPSEKSNAHILVKDFLKPNTADRVLKILERTAHRPALVLDLRDNPGGSVDECLRLASAFLKEGKLVTLDVRSKAAGHHKEIYWLRADCIEVVTTDDNGKYRKSRKLERLRAIATNRSMVVLVNKDTASAAEMLAAALQDHKRASLIGMRSYGKGIAQSGLFMPNGTLLNITCVHYYTPSGKFIGLGRNEKHNFDGITPDISVIDKRVDKKRDVDLQLARAIEIVSLPR
jgi:carboxyl-terminal processing protease